MTDSDKPKKGTQQNPYTQDEYKEFLKQQEEERKKAAQQAGKGIVIRDPKTKKVTGFVRGGDIEKELKEISKDFGKDTPVYYDEKSKQLVPLIKPKEIKKVEQKDYIYDSGLYQKVSIDPKMSLAPEYRKKAETGYVKKVKFSPIGRRTFVEQEKEIDFKLLTKKETEKKDSSIPLILNLETEKLEKGQGTILYAKQREQEIKDYQKYLKKNYGVVLETYKIGNSTQFVFNDKTNAPSFILTGKSDKKGFAWAYSDPIKKLIGQTKEKLIRSTETPPQIRAYLTTKRSYANIKGEKEFFDSQGQLTEIAEDFVIGAAIGIGTSKIITKSPKIVKVADPLLKTGSVVWMAGVPIRFLKVKDKGTTAIAAEFAGDVGFLSGAKLGGISFKKIANLEMSNTKATSLLKNKFKVSTKYNEKVINAKFKTLKASEKPEFIKAVISKFKKIPRTFQLTKKGIKVKTIEPKKFEIIPVKRQIRPRGKRVIRKVRKEQIRKDNLEIKKKKKQFKELVEKQKLKERELKIKEDVDLIRSKRVIKRIRNKKIDKALRNDFVILDKKKSWRLPLSNKYTTKRTEWLKETKILNEYDVKASNLYDRFKDLDILVRTIEALNPTEIKNIPNYKKNLEILKKIRESIFQKYQARIEYKTKLLTYEITENHAAKLALERFKSIKDKSRLDKFIDKPKSDKFIEIETDKGKVRIENGKAYIYSKVEKKTTNGQIQIQEQLVKVVKLTKQQQKQTQKYQQIQEQVTKQKFIKIQAQTQEQLQKQAQKIGQKTVSKLKLISLTKQKVEQKQIQIQKLEQKQELKEEQKQETKQEQKLETKQETKIISEQATKFKQLQLTLQKQILNEEVAKDLITQLINEGIRITPENIKQAKKIKTSKELFDFLKKLKVQNTKDSTKLIKLEDVLKFTPTLRGAVEDIKATKTTGTFTGFETRGIEQKKPLVTVAKDGKTIEGRYAKVKTYLRRIPQTSAGKKIPENVKILRKYNMLSKRINKKV